MVGIPWGVFQTGTLRPEMALPWIDRGHLDAGALSRRLCGCELAKVRLTLFEKDLVWKSHLMDLSKGEQFNATYLKLNPRAVVPTLIHDDIVVIELTVINEYLEEAFPQHPLRLPSAAARARMRLWTKRERLIHDAVDTVTTATVFRASEMEKSQSERDARVNEMPDPARRKKWRELINFGTESDIHEALLRFCVLFTDMEADLRTNPWLAGQEYTLADIGFLSYLNRLLLLQMDHLCNEHFPRVTDWFFRSRSRRGVGWNWGGVVSGVFNLESPGVEAPGWRPRHERRYHAFNDCAA